MTRQLVRGAARWVEIALIPVLWLIPADAMAQRHSRGGGGGGRHFSQPAPRQQSTAISPHSYSESPSNPRRPWPPDPRRPWPPDPRRPWPRPGPVPRPSPVPGPAPVTGTSGGGGWGGTSCSHSTRFGRGSVAPAPGRHLLIIASTACSHSTRSGRRSSPNPWGGAPCSHRTRSGRRSSPNPR